MKKALLICTSAFLTAGLFMAGCNSNTEITPMPATAVTSETSVTEEPSEPKEETTVLISEIQSEAESTEPEIDFSSLKAGDTVTIGTFEQDGDAGNGKEPIEWDVLFADDEKALVVSKYVLFCGEFGKNWDYEGCLIWDYFDNEFYNNAFTDAEKEKIPTVTIATRDADDTSGKIFPLSIEEVKKYYSFNGWDDEVGYSDKLIISPTLFAFNSGVRSKTITEDTYKEELQPYGVPDSVIGTQGAAWWLRDSNQNTGMIYYITYFGQFGMREGHSYEDVGYRPAMYVKK